MKTAILDADVIVHRACSYVEARPMGEVWGFTPEAQIQSICDDIIEQWLEWSTCYELILAFTGEGECHRRNYLPAYKRNRTNPKPENYYDALQELTSRYESVSLPNLEGDDIMGLWLTRGDADVIISPDKDIYTIPGVVLRIPYKEEEKPLLKHNSLVDANRFYFKQALTGDSVDGYKGAPGIGRVQAEKALKDLVCITDMWEKVRNMFVTQYAHKTWGIKAQMRVDPEEAALAMVRCAYILRDGSYDFERGEVIPWTPEVAMQRMIDVTDGGTTLTS